MPNEEVYVSAEGDIYCNRGSDVEPFYSPPRRWPFESLNATCEHGSLVEFDLSPIAEAVERRETQVKLHKSDCKCVEPFAPYREASLSGSVDVVLSYRTQHD